MDVYKNVMIKHFYHHLYCTHDSQTEKNHSLFLLKVSGAFFKLQALFF